MASFKVMASSSSSTTNSDRPSHQLAHLSPSFLTLSSTPAHPIYESSSALGSVNMEKILKNMYTEPGSLDAPSGPIFIGGGAPPGFVFEPRMTLEDFLSQGGAGSNDAVRVRPPLPPPAVGHGGVDAHVVMMGVQFPPAPGPVVHVQNGDGVAQLRYGNGMVAAAAASAAADLVGDGVGRGVGGRGKRRGPPVEELALDKATQQKHRRMIKNRESAARSRERKQAYTFELETLVTHLESENARLLQLEAEQNHERLRQLMENLIPAVEKMKPRRALRRVNSM